MLAFCYVTALLEREGILTGSFASFHFPSSLVHLYRWTHDLHLMSFKYFGYFLGSGCGF
jgi:hypothetical protein